MSDRAYPFNLEFVKRIGADLEPVRVPRRDDRYMLGIGLTSRCNFNCPICYYHGPEGTASGRDMPSDLLARILEQLPRLARIVVGLEGEPLLHGQLAEALQIMAHHAREVVIITNGSLLTATLGRELLALPIPYMMISVDAADAASYAKFRPGGDFDRFRRHVKDAVSLGHKIILHATVFRENLKSLIGLPALARQLGGACISLQQMREHPGASRRGVHAANQQELERWFLELLDAARIHNIRILPDRFFGGPSFHALLCDMADTWGSWLTIEQAYAGECPHAETFAGIMADGSLFPCAGDFAPVAMREYSFDAIFNHPYLQMLRAMHRYGIQNAACSRCMNINSKTG